MRTMGACGDPKHACDTDGGPHFPRTADRVASRMLEITVPPASLPGSPQGLLDDVMPHYATSMQPVAHNWLGCNHQGALGRPVQSGHLANYFIRHRWTDVLDA